MEEADIMEPHVGPAPWISNPVLAPKDDNGIEVTADMRVANKGIFLQTHQSMLSYQGVNILPN